MDGADALPALHIAGTNGKGSTAASLDAMLRAAGYKVALYTSPHLKVIGERLRIGGQMLPVEAWHEALDAVQKALDLVPECRPGYFQIATAASLWLCRREGVQVGVIETGIGGREDATNVLTNTLLSVITPLGMDHMRLLGDSLESIAGHKFGIVKPNSRALFCGSPAEVDGLFLRECAKQDTLGEVFTANCRVSDVESSLDGTSFTLRTPRGECRWTTRLTGLYQADNTALALRALELIDDILPVSGEAKRAGLASVQWPGRMEVFHRSPDLILDGAHNPHGTAALIRALRHLYGDAAQLNFVYASMADKDYMASLGEYARAFVNARLFCTQLENFARCETAAQIAAKASALPWSCAPAVCERPREALRMALENGAPTIVCGSLYFIAHMRDVVNSLEL